MLPSLCPHKTLPRGPESHSAHVFSLLIPPLFFAIQQPTLSSVINAIGDPFVPGNSSGLDTLSAFHWLRKGHHQGAPPSCIRVNTMTEAKAACQVLKEAGVQALLKRMDHTQKDDAVTGRSDHSNLTCL